MDAAAHWADQEIGLLKSASCSCSCSCSSSSMGELRTMVVSSSSSSIKPSTMTRTAPQVMERRMRPSKERPLHCPRCSSTNTKFCYYNNYSLTQPRYFCKTCRRYWTEGGALRNVPVGGGSRKSKKPTTTTTSSCSAAAVATGEPTPLPLSSPAYEKRLIDLTPQEHNTNFQEVKDFDLSHFYSNNSVQNWLLSGPLQETASGAEVYPSGGGLGPPGFLSSGTVGFPMDASMGEGGGRSILPFQHLLQTGGRETNTSAGLWKGVMGDGISR